MKKIPYILIAMAVFGAVFVAACSTPAPAAEQPVQQNAPVVDQQAPAQTFAQACQAVSCAAPQVADTEAINTYCVQKIPYQNILLEPGTTFESLDTKGELKCQDSGTVVDGKTVISCTGKELWTYELKLTNTACSGSALQTGTTSCPADQGYDAANNCCASLSAGGGSTVIKVNIGACPSQ